MKRGERPIRQLPIPLLSGFIILFALQIVSHHLHKGYIDTRFRDLPKPLEATTYQGIAMGSQALMSHLLSLRLQLHDNQVGQHFRYGLMDYDVLVLWLETITEIYPRVEYPVMLASRVYSYTSDQQHLHKLIAFIERSFDRNPQLHWRRMTEATLLAKHKLNDIELALRLAEKIALQPASVEMPHWARDFQFLLLADMNELESAIAIIQALLTSGSVNDVDEIRFLREKLSGFQQEMSESQQLQQN